MKYGILNCWTDQNKGDLGIMISTIDVIKKHDFNARFIGISCFTQKDPYFERCHKYFNNSIEMMYPAILGVLIVKIGKITLKNPIAKGIAGALDFFRFGICYGLPVPLCFSCLSNTEKRIIQEMQHCETLISKGGTIFYNQKSLRSKISLLRICLFYLLLKKWGCKYVIYGQSFGPVHGRLCRYAVRKVVKYSEKTYLRERICLIKYNNLKLPNNKIGFSNDIAFLLSETDVTIKLYGMDIGMTLRPITKNIDESKVYFVELIRRMIRHYQCYIHLLLQVTDENEPDIIFTDNVYSLLSIEEKSFVIYHKEDFQPKELKNIYGKMTLFIGTRLHSTIFALGAGVPTICHIYQGTKAQGIFHELGIEELVINKADVSNTEKLIELVLKNREMYKRKIERGVAEARVELDDAAKEIVEYARIRYEENFSNRF